MAGLLDDISEFIGGSTDPKTMDVSGLTQADRRQALYAGLTDMGSKLWAAGEPMWGPDRAKLLAGIGQVPANMAQMRTTIAQQRLLGVKSAEALQQLQVQQQLNAAAQDPNHALWQGIDPKDRGLAMWAARSGGIKGYLEFLTHKEDATYKKAMADKARIEAGQIQQQMDVQGKIIGGLTGGGATTTQPPVSTAQPPVAPGGTVRGAGGGDAGATLTPEQQRLISSQPPISANTKPIEPRIVPQGDISTPAPGQTPVDPNQPAPPFMSQGDNTQVAQAAPALSGGAEAALPQRPAVPPPTVQPPIQAGARTDIPRAPTTLQEVGKQIPSAQLLPLMGLKGNAFFEELSKLVAPDMTPMYNSQDKQLYSIPKNQVFQLDPRIWKPPAAAQQDFEREKFTWEQQQAKEKQAIEEINSDMAAARQGQKRVKQADGTYRLEEDPNAVATLGKLEAQKAQITAAAQMVPEKFKQEQEKQSAENFSKGIKINPDGQPVADEQAIAANARIKAANAAALAPTEVRVHAAQTIVKQHVDNIRPAAIAARDQIPLIVEAQQLVKQGITAGTFNEFRQFAGKFAETLGMSKMTDDQIRREGYNQLVQRMATQLLQTKALGSGNSITDNDLKFALNQIANSGGNLKIIEQALSGLESGARRTIENYKRETGSLSKDEYIGPALAHLQPVEIPDRNKVIKDLEERQRQLKGNVPTTPGLSNEAEELQRKHGRPQRD